MMSTTTYEPDDTALSIVDPYNDFMSKGGRYYERTKETAEAVGFYDNMRKLIPAVREARIQVIIVPLRNGTIIRIQVIIVTIGSILGSFTLGIT